jgi:tetratricopeptide (TPR) repeat protein
MTDLPGRDDQQIAGSDPDFHLNAGTEGLINSDMVTLLSMLEREPDTTNEKLKHAHLLFAFAQFEAALILLASVPESPDANALRRNCYHSLARWSLETGDLARAEWAAAQHLSEEEGAFESWATRGEVASLRGDDAASLEFFNRALDALPREYATSPAENLEVNRLLYLRVVALVRLGRYQEAFDHWHAVVQRCTENSDLWYLGALCLVQLGRTAEAVPLCQRSIEIDPRHIDAGKLKRRIEAQ